MIFPSGIFYFGDLQLIIGCIVGIRFTLKYNKQKHSFLVKGIITGICGSILTAVSYSVFDWVVYAGMAFILGLIILEFYLIEAIIIGLILGGIIGWYFNYKYATPNKMP
jgi:tetrahydromethanopterin S-methyltransferase subunit D